MAGIGTATGALTRTRASRSGRSELRRGVTAAVGWAFILLCVIVLFSPLVVLVIFSFNSSGVIGLPFQGWTFHWFRALFQNPDAVNALENSIKVALLVMPLSVVLGVVSAYATARMTGPRRAIALGLFSVPLVVPWLVIGIAGLLFFNSIGVQGSTTAVVIMQVVVTFPLVTLILYARLLGMDTSVEEAGLDLGSSHVGVLCRIVLPQLTTPIVVSALFAFISSLGNFVVTFFVSGYTSTMPIWSYSEMRHAENLPLVNAASTVMFLVTAGLFVGVLLVSRRDKDGAGAWF